MKNYHDLTSFADERRTVPLYHYDLPTSTYAGIRVCADVLSVAEMQKGSVIIHRVPLQGGDVVSEIVDWLRASAEERHLKYIAVAYSDDEQFSELLSRLWLELDIVPFRVTSTQEVEELARYAAACFDDQDIVFTQITDELAVEVSELVTLKDYRHTASPEDFQRLRELAAAFAGKRLTFINATPQGGGVALMRHALIRLLKLLNVDAHWYVLMPKKDVFDVTKKKVHNVLQAVTSPDTVLTDEDIALYDGWTRENAGILQNVIKRSDVIVIDDPQPAGLIPYIKYIHPEAKIIYRSHIQIVASLANQPATSQYITWSFLWNKIRLADYFVSHPMKMFVPKVVPEAKILYMPATTDPLDGLNKELSEEQMNYYLSLFNTMLVQDGQEPLDIARPYIIQVARFDPSKGIPDLLESYRKLRIMLEESGQVMPQLVITGNGSVDDPDGIPIYTLIKEMLASEGYLSFASDVKVMRLPHRDQLLNTLLRKSVIALQLSTKEGFEIKVTEALMKGKPVIAYHVGGIPLQIEDGVNGHLVEVGDTTRVAQLLCGLLTDADYYGRMSKAAVELANKDYLTVPNAIDWLFLAVQLTNDAEMEGHYQWVKALASE